MSKKLSHVHLSSDERDQLAHLHTQGFSLGAIAVTLKRSKSTISRELRRNKSPVYNVYLAHRAHQRATERKINTHKRPRLKSVRIRKFVEKHLKKGWSPEQISGRLKRKNLYMQISPEAIYQFVYDPEVRACKDWVPYLTRSHRKRHVKGHRHTHRSIHIPDRTDIRFRPSHIQTRKQFGHWESDTVVTRKSPDALMVVVERKSRFIRLSKISRKTASYTRKAIIRCLKHYPNQAHRTITYDNGSENVEHTLVNSALKSQSFFCTPYHSWEKGTVENTIGLVRRFYPKQYSFKLVTTTALKNVERALNKRPRKCLGFNTPEEVFNAILKY